MKLSNQQLILLILADTVVMAALVLGYLWWQNREQAPPEMPAPTAVSGERR